MRGPFKIGGSQAWSKALKSEVNFQRLVLNWSKVWKLRILESFQMFQCFKCFKCFRDYSNFSELLRLKRRVRPLNLEKISIFRQKLATVLKFESIWNFVRNNYFHCEPLKGFYLREKLQAFVASYLTWKQKKLHVIKLFLLNCAGATKLYLLLFLLS